MGTFLTYCGIGLIAIGTILMYVGTTISSDKYKKEIVTLIMQQTAVIKVNQAEVTKEIVTRESDIRLIIQNLSKIEKWNLLNCVRDPATLFKDNAATRMLCSTWFF